MIGFQEFLKNKPLFYKKIDTDRVKIAYKILEKHISHPKAIHLVGTNGKGSTGRALAYLSYKSGLKVGHYSSPHILKFNERIWINGEDVDNDSLETAHRQIYKILGDELSNALSYFEYTTLLAIFLFKDLDLIVLEAGLGGEFDATTTIQNRVLSIITTIGFDHQNFLGNTIEDIANTKLKSVSHKALISPQIYDEVEDVAQKLSKEMGFRLVFANLEDSKKETIQNILKKRGYPEFLISNIEVAVEALDILKINYSLEDLRKLELFGRFYQLSENIKIDVGHNLLSAKEIVKSLEKNVVLIYNTLSDKDYKEILEALKPKISKVEIIDIDAERALSSDKLEKSLLELKIPFSKFTTISPDKKYLVFGSFYTVEAFLKSYSTF